MIRKRYDTSSILKYRGFPAHTQRDFLKESRETKKKFNIIYQNKLWMKMSLKNFKCSIRFFVLRENATYAKEQWKKLPKDLTKDKTK